MCYDPSLTRRPKLGSLCSPRSCPPIPPPCIDQGLCHLHYRLSLPPLSSLTVLAPRFAVFSTCLGRPGVTHVPTSTLIGPQPQPQQASILRKRGFLSFSVVQFLVPKFSGRADPNRLSVLVLSLLSLSSASQSLSRPRPITFPTLTCSELDNLGFDFVALSRTFRNVSLF